MDIQRKPLCIKMDNIFLRYRLVMPSLKTYSGKKKQTQRYSIVKKKRIPPIQISIGRRKKEAGVPPDNDLCFVKFQSMILPRLPSPLLLRCSSTTFNLGSNCRTKLISYSNVRLGACEAPSPTAHLAPSAAVSSSCNSLDAAAISTLAPKPALDQRAIWLNMENSIMFIAKPTKLQIPRATVRDIFHRLLLRCRVIY